MHVPMMDTILLLLVGVPDDLGGIVHVRIDLDARLVIREYLPKPFFLHGLLEIAVHERPTLLFTHDLLLN